MVSNNLRLLTVNGKKEIVKHVISIPLAQLFSIGAILIIIISLYLPWWGMIDNTIGPLRTIHLYKSMIGIPEKMVSYIWAEKNQDLRTVMIYPLILMILALFSSISTLFLIFKENSKIGGILALLSGVLIISSSVFFQVKLSSYLRMTGETITGSIGFLHWGLGLGWRLSLVAIALLAFNALFLLSVRTDTSPLKVEFEFEKESEDI